MNSLYVLEITREEHLRLSPDASHLQIPSGAALAVLLRLARDGKVR